MIRLPRLTAALALVAGSLATPACRSYYLLDDDVLPTDDGGADAGPGAGACAPGPDGAPPLFCDDFESGDLASRWDDSTLELGGISTVRARSGTRALRVDVTTTRDLSDYVAKGLGVSGTSALRVELAMYVERTGAMLPFGLFCGSRGYSVALDLGGRVVENGGGVPYRALRTRAALPTGRWVRVTLVLRRAERTVALAYDDEVVLAETPLGPTDDTLAGDCRLLVGLFFAPSGQPWTAFYDDVRVTAP